MGLGVAFGQRVEGSKICRSKSDGIARKMHTVEIESKVMLRVKVRLRLAASLFSRGWGVRTQVRINDSSTCNITTAREDPTVNHAEP